jgi:tRNA-dihydrouridine synthase
MRDVVDIDVTVKHRIGIDQIEHYDYLAGLLIRCRWRMYLYRTCAQCHP